MDHRPQAANTTGASEPSRCDRSEGAAPAEQLESQSPATVPKLRITTCDMRRVAHCPKECLNRSDATCLVHLHPKSMPLTPNAFSPRLTPELSRAAKRRRLGRTVRRDVKAEADLLQAGATTVMRGSPAASCEHLRGRESSRRGRSEGAAPAEQLESESPATVPKLRMTTCDMRRAADCPKECLNRSDETCLVHLHPKSMPLTRNAFSPRLTA